MEMTKFRKQVAKINPQQQGKNADEKRVSNSGRQN